jgi:hypothetical protein
MLINHVSPAIHARSVAMVILNIIPIAPSVIKKNGRASFAILNNEFLKKIYFALRLAIKMLSKIMLVVCRKRYATNIRATINNDPIWIIGFSVI